MKKMLNQLISIWTLLMIMMSCMAEKEGLKTKEIVMYANLINEEEAIKQYEYYHSKEGIWPEVGMANKASGIKQLKMYRFQNQLIMIMTVPKDVDLKEMDKKYINSSDKIKEWGVMMNDFFETLQIDGEEKVWVEMKKVHHYEDGGFK